MTANYELCIMNYELNIRKAAKTDAPLIAKVVAMAIGEESAILYGGENYMNVFEEIALLEDSQYSYRNAFVAEINGNAVGAVVAYDGAELYPLRKTTLEIIYKHTAKELQIADETDSSEFYLDSLAVLPEYQGHWGEQFAYERDERGEQQCKFLRGCLCKGLRRDLSDRKDDHEHEHCSHCNSHRTECFSEYECTKG